MEYIKLCDDAIVEPRLTSTIELLKSIDISNSTSWIQATCQETGLIYLLDKESTNDIDNLYCIKANTGLDTGRWISGLAKMVSQKSDKPIVHNIPPSPNDDETKGYEVASQWVYLTSINPNQYELYSCFDSQTGNADWRIIATNKDIDYLKYEISTKIIFGNIIQPNQTINIGLINTNIDERISQHAINCIITDKVTGKQNILSFQIFHHHTMQNGYVLDYSIYTDSIDDQIELVNVNSVTKLIENQVSIQCTNNMINSIQLDFFVN